MLQGHTKMLNFFRVDISATVTLDAPTKGPLMVVDMPGYGYANVPVELKLQWNRMAIEYLRSRRWYVAPVSQRRLRLRASRC